LSYIMYVGRLRSHIFVFKYLLSGTPEGNEDVRKKRNVDNF